MEFPDFSKKNYLKFLLLIIIIPLLLNIIATAIWDLCLKGAYPSIKFAIFDFAQFVMEYISRIDYTEVAKGSHERIALKIYSSLFIAAAGITILLMFIGYDTLKRKEREIKELNNNIETTLNGKEYSSGHNAEFKSLETAKIELNKTELLAHKTIRDHLISCFVLTLCLTNLFFSIIKDTYIDSAVAHFNQCCTIITPFVSSKDMAQIKSEFSQIEIKEDFENVLSRLKDKCSDKNIKLPNFKTW